MLKIFISLFGGLEVRKLPMLEGSDTVRAVFVFLQLSIRQTLGVSGQLYVRIRVVCFSYGKVETRFLIYFGMAGIVGAQAGRRKNEPPYTYILYVYT